MLFISYAVFKFSKDEQKNKINEAGKKINDNICLIEETAKTREDVYNYANKVLSKVNSTQNFLENVFAAINKNTFNLKIKFYEEIIAEEISFDECKLKNKNKLSEEIEKLCVFSNEACSNAEFLEEICFDIEMLLEEICFVIKKLKSKPTI